MVKMQQSWTGKKSPTNAIKKEQHESRKVIKKTIKEIREKDWKQQLKDFYAN